MTAKKYFKQGNDYYRQGEYDKAIESYKEAIELKPDDAAAYYNLGNAYNDLGEYAQAIESYKKAIKLKPDDVAAYYNLGNAYYNRSEYAKAIESYHKAIELKPDDADAYNNLGNAYKNMGEYAQAIKLYKKAIEIKPDYVAAYSNQGNAYKNLGEYAKAIKLYHKAIELKPDFSALVYNNFGNAYKNKGEYAKAIKLYHKAIELKPDFLALVYNNLGNVYKIQGKYFKAIELYNKAEELNLEDDSYFSDTLKKHEIKKEDDKYAFCKDIYVHSNIIMRLLHVNNNKETTRGFAHYTRRDIAEKLLIKKKKDVIPVSMLDSIATASDPKKKAKTFQEEVQKEKSVSPFRLNSILTSNDPTEGEIIFKYFGWENEKEEDRKYHAFIACFTFDPESLNQFRLYGKEQGKEATGVSFVFKEAFFAEDAVYITSSITSGNKDCKEYIKSDIKEEYVLRCNIDPETRQIVALGHKDDHTLEKDALYRCIYIDPETMQIVALGHKDDYTFFRDRQDEEGKKQSDKAIKTAIKKYNKKISDNLQAVRAEFEKLKGLIEEKKEGKDKASKKLICDLLINLRYLVKHIAFKEEQECRIVKVASLVNNDKVKLEGNSMFMDTKPVDRLVKQVYFAPYATDMELFHEKLVYTGLDIKCHQCTHPIRIART
jgi:tetratricopeptide (TPR) repeat protein